MNDLERELRALLDEKAARAGAPMPDARLLRRARRRQLRTVLGGAVVAAAIASGAALALPALRPWHGTTPAEPVELIESTVNGITITHPEGWYVVDPAEAGLNPPSEDLPRLVLLVSDADPIASGTLGCPGLAEGTADTFVFTVQQIPLDSTGEASRRWPVPLEPMEVDDPESRCYSGWTFLRASWTAGERSFEARVGIGPDVPEAERAAIEAAFASLRFVPTGAGPEAVVLATGTAGGEDWELVASRGSDGLELMLGWRTGGSGFGGFSDALDAIHLTTQAFGEGDAREVVVFGAVPARAEGLELMGLDGERSRPIEILDVPDELDPSWNAFVVTVGPDETGVLNAYRAGELLASEELGPPAPTETPPPPPSMRCCSAAG